MLKQVLEHRDNDWCPPYTTCVCQNKMFFYVWDQYIDSCGGSWSKKIPAMSLLKRFK
jgi:hypothetical protein